MTVYLCDAIIGQLEGILTNAASSIQAIPKCNALKKGLYRYVQIRSEDLVRLLLNEYRARECDQLILAFLFLIDWETGPTLDSIPLTFMIL